MLRPSRRFFVATLVCGVLLGATATAASASAPTVTISPATGASGQTFVVTGAGWPAYDRSIQVFLTVSGSPYEICYVSSDSTGKIAPTGCSVPTGVPAGNYAYGANDGTISVGAAKPVTIVPGVVAMNTYGQNTSEITGGESVAVSGSGFAASSPISATLNGNPVAFSAPTSTSGQGYLSAAKFRVPPLKAGTGSLVVRDGGGHSATARLFVYAPKLAVAPLTPLSGHGVSLSGSGFPANASLNADLTQGSNLFGLYCPSLVTDGTGALPAQMCTMPTYAPAGSGYQLLLTDQRLDASFPIKFAPGIFAVNIPSGQTTSVVAAGQVVSVKGSGFRAGSGLSATFNSTSVTLGAVTKTDSNGAFTGTTFTVPKTTGAGIRTLVVRDGAGDSATVKLSVVRAPTVKPSSTALLSNTGIAVSGSGWFPLDTVTLYLYTPAWSYAGSVGTIYADANGILSGQSATVSSNVPAGKYELVASDGEVAIGVPVTVVPTISVTTSVGSPAGGASPGTTLNLAGYGFAANSNITSVTLGSTGLKVTASSPPLAANANGSFYGASFVVPKVGHATYVLKVRDGASDTATANLSVV